MKVSIITVVYNNARFIAEAMHSVAMQSYANIEHIIVDGGSTDNTIEVINRYKTNKTMVFSEPDHGIYDAMNKGIRMSTGDVLGFINSDDLYANEDVISDVVQALSGQSAQTCYGDLVYVDRNNIGKVIRYWKSGAYRRERFYWGWMPPHPSFFAKADVYRRYGFFNLDFPLAADYELMLRFLYKHKVSAVYLPRVLVKMRTGGTSQPMSYTAKAILENYESWKVNGLKANPLTFIFKPMSKLFQFLHQYDENGILAKKRVEEL